MASFKETFDFSKWDQAKFDAYRQIEDPVADKVARVIINSPHYSQVYEALGKVIKNSDVITLELFAQIVQDRSRMAGPATTSGMAGADAPPANPHAAAPAPVIAALPDSHNHGRLTESQYHLNGECTTDKEHEALVDELNNYFNDLSLFDFVHTDASTLDMGSDIFNYYYVHCTFALATRSLMKQYAAFNATQVLRFTKLITNMPYRRIMETVQFVMDIMDPIGFTPDGCAIRSIQKLRLVHAMIRTRIHEKLYDKNKAPGEALLGDWYQAEWGAPINQQDMIFAVHTFSIEVMDALVGIGEFSLNNKEDRGKIEAYYMMWHHIGRALGTVDEVNPVTYDDGKKLQAIIYAKQFRASPNVDLLVPPLVGFIAKLLSVHDDKKVYALTKYYNKSAEDRDVFRNVLKIDLVKDADRHFYRLIAGSFKIIKIILTVTFALVSKEKRNKIVAETFTRNYDLLKKIIFIASDGQYATNGHFRVADGFGLPAPVINYANYNDQEPFFSSLFTRILGRVGSFIKLIIVNMFTKNAQKK
jgi:hypothetical protein